MLLLPTQFRIQGESFAWPPFIHVVVVECMQASTHRGETGPQAEGIDSEMEAGEASPSEDGEGVLPETKRQRRRREEAEKKATRKSKQAKKKRKAPLPPTPHGTLLPFILLHTRTESALSGIEPDRRQLEQIFRWCECF